MNFGEQTKKFYWLELSHPSGFFGGDYISDLRGCCPLKFSYALEIDQVLLVHTNMGMRVRPPFPPPQKKTFGRENLKFGLKFSVLFPHFGASAGILTTRRVMNFGPQTKTFCWLPLSHPSGFFGGDYISALRGCCSSNFYTR